MNAADKLKNIRVVLCGTSHPGNIGAAARALKTMGLTRLYLVTPAQFPDPEARWRAVRATDILARATLCANLDEALNGVAFAVACSARSREVAVPEVPAREAARRVIDAASGQQAALVFGNETHGLTTAEVNKCRLLATIPANPKYSSLNLAAAVQVFAYELRMAAMDGAARGEKSGSRAFASFEEVEGFYEQLERTMVEVGFLNPQHPKKLMPRLRRLFARAQLEKEEVNILRGLLKALGRLRSGRR
ncbi:MAG: tRNA (cytosine(32)/uridine(32)-2'-O)-methyltransferase TrmJ [Betaproteobacteria bacterium RIFCSPLOWO2_12_FULL_62_13]|nr:MAG: tRNA (cytosine(32)/uridine(32)-2'-O)-methyltransferase TrmJ [Betaproteobacteria bacterium RIFCSPLOWO2_12_FULL_62_13]